MSWVNSDKKILLCKQQIELILKGHNLHHFLVSSHLVFSQKNVVMWKRSIMVALNRSNTNYFYFRNYYLVYLLLFYQESLGAYILSNSRSRFTTISILKPKQELATQPSCTTQRNTFAPFVSSSFESRF